MAVNLNYQVHGTGKPVFMLHGLFGSARNWTGLARRLEDHYQVITIDVRNHSSSEHADDMSYTAMAEDLYELVQALGFTEINLIGHSMGGKIAMVYALQEGQSVQKLIILDIAPVTYQNDYSSLLDSLQALPVHEIENRNQADALLSVTINDAMTRNFLLQNLVRNGDNWSWRINLSSIRNNIEAITGFPGIQGRQYRGPALFLGGGESTYILAEHHQAIEDHFPQVNIDYIDKAGHLLHIDQPDPVLDHIKSFLG